MLVPYNVDVPMARLPIANWVLIGVTVVVSFAVFVRWHHDRVELTEQEIEAIEREYELKHGRPMDEVQLAREIERREAARTPPPPLSLRWSPFVPVWAFTYQFVHGDFFHLLGNMVFLFCFGNAVNAKLGHWQFFSSYLLLGVLSGLAFLPFAGGRPLVGASGAIMGIVGLFVVLFPRNDVEIFYWFGILWAGVTRIAAYWVVLFFVVCDLIGVAFDSSGGVAYLAHVVGFASGFGLGIALVKLRAVRSSRHEENLLEVLGYQRKAEGRRKRRRPQREEAPARGSKRRSMAELLADGSDYDICQGVYRRVLRRHGDDWDATDLGPEERVAVLVWHSLRLIDEGGFNALFEEGIPGDRRLTKTAEAYHAIGCPRAGNAIRKAAAVLSGAEEDIDDRVGRSLQRLAGMPAAEERKFLEVMEEVESRLVEYVRVRRDVFLNLR